MIKVDNISKKFIRNIKKDSGKKSFGKRTKEEFYAVNEVSFEAKEGEILGILGPNGAGKTTLLRMLASLMTPNEGEVKIFRADGTLIDNPVDKKKYIGYLSGNTKLYNRFSTREMLKILADVYGMSREETEKRIAFIIYRRSSRNAEFH